MTHHINHGIKRAPEPYNAQQGNNEKPNLFFYFPGKFHLYWSTSAIYFTIAQYLLDLSAPLKILVILSMAQTSYLR